jgi:TRAP transporter 4TM/12TM fusion protein
VEKERETGAAPSASRAVQRLTVTLAVLLTSASICWAADLYRGVFGLLLFNQQIIAGMIGISLALVYLHVPAGKGPRTRLPWYDALAAVAGLVAAFYTAIKYERLFMDMPFLPVDALISSSIILLLVLEGLRRVAGKVLLIIVLVFIAYALFGEYVPGELEGRPVDWRDLVLYQTLDPHGLLGPIVGIALTIVVTFIFFGTLLFRSGGSNFFTDLSLALMGNFRGGSAKIAVTASALFGSISGSAVANVASTGVITIPMMKEGGYRPEHAGAIEAVASTGGQLMPPIMGASAFLMAEFLEVPYTAVVTAALIPAILYYVALFIQVDLEAARTNITRVDKSRIPPVGEVFKAGWFFPIPFAVLIGGLFWLNLPPELAALYGAIVLTFFGVTLGYRGKRMTLRILATAISATGFAVIDIVMIAAAASFIIAILNLSGLGFALTLSLVQLGAGNLALLLILGAGISIVLGMGMPTIGVYVLLASLIAPALIEVGVAPIAAHLFVLYFGMMSMITPPVAIAAYAAATIAKAEPIKTCLSAIRFGWPAYVIPFLFVLSPSFLFRGDIGAIVLAVASAVGGVWLITVGVIGYFSKPLDPLSRVGFCAAGLALLVPANVFAGAIWTDVAGVIVGALLLTREFTAARRLRTA